MGTRDKAEGLLIDIDQEGHDVFTQMKHEFPDDVFQTAPAVEPTSKRVANAILRARGNPRKGEATYIDTVVLLVSRFFPFDTINND